MIGFGRSGMLRRGWNLDGRQTEMDLAARYEPEMEFFCLGLRSWASC